MPERGWRSKTPLRDWLYAEPYRFDFLQAVLLLERMRPEAAPLGEGADPEREAVRLAATSRLDFAASALESLTQAAGEAQPPLLRVNFFGIAGAEGPLPPPLLEMLQQRTREHDFSLRDFFDIFHHRLLALWFRGARAHRAELAARTPEESPTGLYLRAFAGLGLAGLRQRLPVADRGLLYYAGLLWQRPHSATGLERMLSDFFRVRFRLRQMRGGWRTLPPEAWTRLGGSGQNQVLGQGAVLGQRVWLQAAGAELETGPLTLAQFLELLPSGQAMAALQALVRLYAGPLCRMTVCLQLEAGAAAAAALGRAHLGWTSWLSREGQAAPALHVRFALDASG
ncbi:MAG: type VI secretion system baseplate subunit TssG [Terriglobales bacterium]